MPIHCTASKCLFVAAGSKSFVQLDGLETDERAAEKFVFNKDENNRLRRLCGMLGRTPAARW